MPQPYVLLVIECTENYNWYEYFEGATVLGRPVQVEQASWQDITLSSYPTNCVVTIRRARNPIKGTSQEAHRTVVVDFVFLRSVSRGIAGMDSRNLLLGLLHQNLGSVNSLQSAYLCCERPTTFAALKEIQSRLGDDFPVIEQTYYASHREMMITPEFPIVCKVGHAQSGYGKMRLTSHQDLPDFASVCALHGDYVTAEPFIEWDWDGRVQKIGSHYRAFKRISTNWKGNVGNQSIVEEMEITDQMIRWADECSKVFGGLDILGLDFVHSKKDGKFYILELNDTAIGLVHAVADEDMKYMRDLVLSRMEEHFSPVDEEGVKNEELGDELKRTKDALQQMKQELERERQARQEVERKLKEKEELQLQTRSFWKFW